MAFQSDPARITWRAHVKASPERVFQALASAEGRETFWAEVAPESDGIIHFVFPDGTEYDSRILRKEPPRLFSIEYFGSIVTILLDASEAGTDLSLIDEGVESDERTEVIAGWVSVLLQLKAAIEFDVDLRNHSSKRNWRTGYVEN